jgi:stringent starvation protein B
MTSNKPYLIRALYEWLADNDATPYLLVDTTRSGVDIPPGIEKDGQVVLNIAMSAVKGLEMTNSHIRFSARFGGVSHDIYIPVEAVMAIYSREDGAGMMFAEGADDTRAADDTPAGQSVAADEKPKKNGNKRPSLKLVD